MENQDMATVNTQVWKYVDDTVVLSGYANTLTTRIHKKKNTSSLVTHCHSHFSITHIHTHTLPLGLTIQRIKSWDFSHTTSRTELHFLSVTLCVVVVPPPARRSRPENSHTLPNATRCGWCEAA